MTAATARKLHPADPKGATGLMFPIFLSSAIDIAPAQRRGLAVGAVTTSIFLGQALSPLVGQPLIERVGFSPTFGLTAALFVALAVVALAVFRDSNGPPVVVGVNS
ncbi:MAG: MFS transporter [Pseudoxanthomonas sp.]|nr:MFS transporter [Pseudoxanthomonas sp.]